MVPANRHGYLSGVFTGYQLKIIQECITLAVFVVFATLVLKEKLASRADETGRLRPHAITVTPYAANF